MNRNDLFDAMNYIDDKMIETSEVKKTVRYQKKYSKRTFLLVAILCMLAVFATAAVAAKLFSLRAAIVDTNAPESESEMSLSGFTGSNEYLAAAEWKAFADQYDPDGSILANADPEGPEDFYIGEKYVHYDVYTQEMADKLDEISAKYGLTLHSTLVPGGVHTLAEKLIINDYTEFSDGAYNSILDGYMYNDGTFSFDGIFDASSGHLSVNYQFRCSVKGVFDPVFLTIGDIESYQEQVLVTDSGVEFVAAISEDQSVLITEFDSCFICINILGGADMGITFDDLTDLANTFDFTVIESGKNESVQDPKKPANAGMEQDQEYIEIVREGVVEKIPVETIRIGSTDSTIAAYPEYFNHHVLGGVDTFTYDAWDGERKVYYSVYHIAHTNPNQICEDLFAVHGETYANRNVYAVKVGDYDATTVQFDGAADAPSYQLHFYIIPTNDGCIVIEAQFDFEMYEGLYRIMLALFTTLKIS